MQEPHEFKVEVVSEGVFGTVIFGASKLPVRKMELVLCQAVETPSERMIPAAR